MLADNIVRFKGNAFGTASFDGVTLEDGLKCQSLSLTCVHASRKRAVMFSGARVCFS